VRLLKVCAVVTSAAALLNAFCAGFNADRFVVYHVSGSLVSACFSGMVAIFCTYSSCMALRAIGLKTAEAEWKAAIRRFRR